MPLRLGRRRMDSKERIYDVSNIVPRDIIRSRCIYAVVQKSELWELSVQYHQSISSKTTTYLVNSLSSAKHLHTMHANTLASNIPSRLVIPSDAKTCCTVGIIGVLTGNDIDQDRAKGKPFQI